MTLSVAASLDSRRRSKLRTQDRVWSAAGLAAINVNCRSIPSQDDLRVLGLHTRGEIASNFASPQQGNPSGPCVRCRFQGPLHSRCTGSAGRRRGGPSARIRSLEMAVVERDMALDQHSRHRNALPHGPCSSGPGETWLTWHLRSWRYCMSVPGRRCPGAPRSCASLWIAAADTWVGQSDDLLQQTGAGICCCQTPSVPAGADDEKSLRVLWLRDAVACARARTLEPMCVGA